MLRRSAIVLALCALSVASSFAQSSFSSSPAPLRGFVPPYEILRTVRAAGFEPLAPPLREGTTYIVRAIDFRGVAMRVVVDARSGAIRDANRIVAGPGLYGPYAPGPYATVYYGRFAAPAYPLPDHASDLSGSDRHASGLNLVPLPRPRPASLTASTGIDARPVTRTGVASAPAAVPAKPSNTPAKDAAIPAIND